MTACGGLYLQTGCCRRLQAPSPELTGHKEEKQEAPSHSFTFMENTCRVYKDREVLVSSACLFPLASLPRGGFLRVTHLRMSSDKFYFFTVSLISDGKLETKHRVRRRNYRHKKQMRKKVKLAIYMTSLTVENWVTRGTLSYFWTAVL